MERHLKASAFQFGIADAVAVDGRRGSNVYEVNPWLWQFGRGSEASAGGSVCVLDPAEPRRGARRSSGLGRRGVKRPAAAARQLGADSEMNETYGPSLVPLEGFPRISQVMQVYDSYTCLSRDMQVLKIYPCISRFMQV